MRISIILSLIALPVMIAKAQNWETFGGSSSRSGLSRVTGPVSTTNLLWQAESQSNTSIGMAVYSFGDRFVNSRTTFSPYNSRVECRDLSNGNLHWVSPFISSSSILYAIGMNEDAVYAHDYDTDSIYALNINDGSIKWRSAVLSLTFGAYPGCVFACNGDPILNGPAGSDNFTMRLDKTNGELIWTNNEVVVIAPAVPLAANNSTVYRVTGGFTIPVKLTAIDINTGLTKYSSNPVPGNPDQEDPLILGPDSMIYFWRDEGNLFAYQDNGTSLVQQWMYEPLAPVSEPNLRNISLGQGKTLYIFESNQVKRLNAQTGVVQSSLNLNIGSSASISIGCDSTVYINNGLGVCFAYSADLQILKWQKSIPSGIYLNPPLCKEGTLVLTQSGSTITGLRDTKALAPVADFRCTSRIVTVGLPVDFFDQSSYMPTSWNWQFPGSTLSNSIQQNPTGIVYTSPGTYPVSLIVQNAKGIDSCIKTCYVEVMMTTSIKEQNLNIFQVFPNPVHDFMYITNKSGFKHIEFELIDMKGNIVLTSVYNYPGEQFDISAIQAGNYILRFKRYGIPGIRLVKQ